MSLLYKDNKVKKVKLYIILKASVSYRVKLIARDIILVNRLGYKVKEKMKEVRKALVKIKYSI